MPLLLKMTASVLASRSNTAHRKKIGAKNRNLSGFGFFAPYFDMKLKRYPKPKTAKEIHADIFCDYLFSSLIFSF